MLLYGIGAWGARTEFKYVRMALEAIQRPFLIIITSAFQSTSTPALQVLAGIMPLGLKAQARWTNFLTGGVGGVHTIGQRTFGDTLAETKECLDATHPAERVSVPFDRRRTYVGEIDIYTDGSKINGKVGAAFVVYYFGVKIAEELRQLPDTATVFQAELLAIQHALLWCRKGCVHPQTIPQRFD